MRRKKMQVAIVVLVSILFLAPSAFAADAIKVGVVDSYSGGAASLANDNLKGLKLAIGEVNAKGGVLGKKIEIMTRDDKFQPGTGLPQARDLVLKEGVDLLVGTYNSAIALAISEFAKKEKIPFLVTGAKSERITGQFGHRYVFLMDETTVMPGKAAAAVLAKKPYTKYWIAGDDFEFGHALTDSVWNHLKALNPKVQLLGKTFWKMGEIDFTPYITQIMSAKPDCLIMGSSGATVIAFQKAAKATGLSKAVPEYQHTAIDYAILNALGLNAPEGVYGTAHYLFYYPQTPENKAFVETYRKAYNSYPTMPSYFGYITGHFIAEAYKKAGKVDKEKFIDALEGAVLERSPVGRLELRACDHQVMHPTFFGVTKKVPEYKDFLIGTDIATVSARDAAPTCEDIAKARAKGK
ncbi:MAG TPA: ABC transporter substrate-binding protein [Syntrophorhabdaceae bacterium]|jgi:branched-chain amino acid transport system substrate-binding protein